MVRACLTHSYVRSAINVWRSRQEAPAQTPTMLGHTVHVLAAETRAFGQSLRGAGGNRYRVINPPGVCDPRPGEHGGPRRRHPQLAAPRTCLRYLSRCSASSAHACAA